MFPTHQVVTTDLFQLHSEGLPVHERVKLAYKRAQAIARAYGLIDLYLCNAKFTLTLSWQV